MASTKKANNTNNASNDAGAGFRTATFGFDKNDVTLYIASLRKKMKAIEDEYEQKLIQAQENSAESNDDLKREYAIKLADKEKQWNDKILEHTSTINNQQEQINNQQDQIKKQQDQINQLEKQLSERDKTIDSLKTQLSAASANNGKASSAAGTKAEEAYMQFTSELRSISESAQRTLASIEQMWNSELGVSEAARDTAPAAKPAQTAAPAAKPAQAAEPAEKPVQTAEPAEKPAQVVSPAEKPAQVVSPAATPAQAVTPAAAPTQPAAPAEKPVQTTAPAEKPVQVAAPAAKPVQVAAPEPVNKPIEVSSIDADFGSLLADDKDDFVDLISNTNNVNLNIKSEPVLKPAPAAAEISDDFASLLADNNDNYGAVTGSGSFESAVPKGGNFDADLFSDIIITPKEEHNGGDLGKMLKEKEEKEFDAFKDLFVSDSTSEGSSSGFSDFFVTPIEETDYKPGISSEFDLKPFDNADMNGSGDFFSNVNSPVNKPKAESAFVNKNKEDDLFDFSFLVADDDEDDMSSDAFDFR